MSLLSKVGWTYPLGWLTAKGGGQKITSVGEDVEKSEPSCSAGGNVKSIVFLQNVKNRIPPLGIHPQELKSWSGRGICTPMLTAVLLAIAEGESSSVSVDGWTDKQNMAYTYKEYHSASKRKGILTPAPTQMNPEDIVLSERSAPKRQMPCDSITEHPFIQSHQVHTGRE